MRKVIKACTLLGVLGAFACSDAPTGTPMERGPLTPAMAINVISTAQTVNGALWTPRYDAGSSVGSGVIRPFLDMQASPNEDGFNTDNDAFLYDQHRTSDTNKLPLNYVPVINVGGALGFAREFVMDANESNSSPDPQFSIDAFDLWLCDDTAAVHYNERSDFENNSNCALVYDLGGDTLLAADSTKGSGNVFDYRILIPETFFQNAADDLGVDLCPYLPTPTAEEACGQYLILWSAMGYRGGNFITDATFEEYSTILRAYVDVSKTADEELTRTHLWKIVKSVDPNHHNLFPGQTDSSDYEVTVVDTGTVDSGWAVSGVITIDNPSSDTVRITAVTDSISGFGPVSVICGETLPFVLDEGETLECTYTTTLPNGDSRTNYANVVLGDGGTSQASTPIDFTEAVVTHVNDEVTVVDKYNGGSDELLGEVTDSTTFEYPRPFTCDDVPSKTDIARILETGQADTATVTIACGSLTVEKTATTTFTRTYDWSIEKTVTPDTWDLFSGDDGTSDYEVTVLKTGYTDSDWAVSGTIKVINSSSFAATLGAVTDTISGVGSVAVNCGVTVAGHVLAAGDTLECTYSSALTDGSARTNRAYASIQGNGFWGDTAAITFGAPTTEVNDSVDVTDSVEGALGTIDDDSTFTYSTTFECDDDEGTHENIASIVQTGQADTASVTVTCYDLVVTKTAPVQLNRRFEWDIDKELDTEFFLEGTLILPDTAVIQEGQTLQAHYEITIDTTGSVDSAWAIGNGTIKVVNPNPSLAALINDLTDVVSPAIAAVVDCGSVTFPYSLAAADSLACTYDADLPDGTDRTDTATAVLQNHSYDSEGTGTPTGTSNFSGTAETDFSTATITEIDECVDVNDLLSSTGTPVDSTDLGSYCTNQTLPHTFDVYYDFGPEDIVLECGLNEFDNTATFVTNDTESTGSDDASLNILVECEEGCTLTQGYWKTHNQSFADSKNGHGPAPDDTWFAAGADFDGDGTLEGEDENFFATGMTWFQVFNTAPKGNVYYSLAHQYMAAVLNTLAGASPTPAVQDALDDAYALFTTYSPATVGNWKGNNPNRAQFITLAGILGSFNEGDIGPGHCTENDITIVQY